MWAEVNKRHTHFGPSSAPKPQKSLTSGPDAGSLDVEGGIRYPSTPFPSLPQIPNRADTG
jgi:hypothetical protein